MKRARLVLAGCVLAAGLAGCAGLPLDRLKASHSVFSDLAGGGEGENEMGAFMGIAADNSAKVLVAFLAAWK